MSPEASSGARGASILRFYLEAEFLACSGVGKASPFVNICANCAILFFYWGF